LADSFEGMPEQEAEDKVDWDLAGVKHLAVSLEDVMANFRRFNLLDERVKFIRGWFSDTLPSAKVERIALLRLDGDYYSSTMDALNGLYDKVSPRGYIIVDDYANFNSCRKAIADFRANRNIEAEMSWIDECAVYWRKV
jgi:hypothetical protein